MEGSTPKYDLAIAWTWRYDDDFVRLILEASRHLSLSVLCIDSATLPETIDLVRKHKIFIRVFLDRASDEDDSFVPLARLIQKQYRDESIQSSVRPVNPLDLVVRAADKATMHLEFLANGINVPFSIIISPYNHKREVELSLSDLAKLGRPFIIKPANTTGGGIGVVKGAETLKDVIDARRHHRNDKYLIQETVKPAYLGDFRAWFRVFYAFGRIIPCWWDDQTHTYEVIVPEDEQAFGLGGLRLITSKIQQICKLDFFSTELVFTRDQKFVAVDYVNEMCDMRLQSVHRDGVPDMIVGEIVHSLVTFVKECSQNAKTGRGC